MVLLKILITLLCILVGVAYMTLLERKLLSLIQTRKGPNKVGLSGILQPFSDAVKLFLKEMVLPVSSNKRLFILLPVVSLAVGLFMWGLLPSHFATSNLTLGVMLFLCISATNVYITMGAGWASNSSYAFLGGVRAAAQTISYEISMAFILLTPCMLILSLDLYNYFSNVPVLLLLPYVFLMWFLSVLAETNRAPFDFAEGESELVSGFNVEYSGGLFALLFLGEYTIILFMSLFVVLLFLSPNTTLSFSLLGTFIAMGFLVTRGVYPRHRYDMLMSLCWKSILPLSLSFVGITCVMFWL